MHRFCLRLSHLLLFGLITANADAQLTPRTAAIVDDAVAKQMKQQKAVGAAVGIIQDGKLVYLKGYGFEDRERNIRVSKNTMFRWASISKTLTAYSAMQLVEKNRLSLDADIRKLVPEFPSKKATISSRDLLCHQAGIVHYSNGKVIRSNKNYTTANPFKSVINALDTFKESPLIAPPGTRYSYSSHGFILLSAVVERAGRQPFADQVRDRIVRPLKLETLQPDYQWVSIPNRAVGYRLRNGKIVRSTNTDVSWKLGGGGYISNIKDLALYAQAMMNGKLLSARTQNAMWTPQKTKDGKVTPLGLGVFASGTGAQLKISHSGSQEKAKTRLVIYPNQKSGVVVMSNSENVNPGEISTAVYRALAISK